ncbi:hairy/enhancer-of-split related with YRPW motif protein 1-like [Ylistrum balloti]|uniref:hairy/enhancer-of-split related with YRPW motif protein 1-like n=1 Tax=Ylistrum balloti TaxID=509963 RepID=UPI002905B19B|nr:hairy/enhancer-of-split related with YRPW motif protein 1-like [Ylistrum balloti]
MKRSLSDSDSESLFDDDLKSSGSPSQSCHVTDRKKRRGVIEKRRRDRINNSLSELRRLVPSAFEKQGSAKLEKAEILQMTVDHLKMLHQKGLNGYNYPDPHNLAVDYRGVGYRECASEVARYLVAVEGMDLQDPMRMRLLSHLQCFSAQREAAAKASLQNSTWSSMTPHAPITNQYGTGSSMQSMGSMISSQQNNQSELAMSTHSSHQGISSVSFSEARVSQPESLHGNLRLPSSMNVPLHGQMSNMNTAAGQQVSPSLIPQLHGQFPVSLNSMQSMMSQNGSNNYNNNAVKPYRPWGSELAY